MPTLKQDLEFYGTTLNPAPDARGLMRSAAAEIDRLEALVSPVKCSNCEKKIERADEWFRCFDCRAHLCENCVRDHFGKGYTPHHQTMDNYKRTIEILERKLNASQKVGVG